MRNSAFDKTGFPLFLILSLVCSLTAIAEPPAVIEDGAIKRRFETELTKLLDKESTGRAERLLQDLRREKRGIPDLSLAEGFPEGGIDVSVYRQVLPSALAFGRLYLCDKCSNLHGNLSGGVAIAEGGIVATNFHVMNESNAKAFGAIDSEGRVYAVSEVLASSLDDDLAIVRLANCDLRPVPLADEPTVGDDLHLVSHPDGHFFTYTRGYVSRFYREEKSKALRMQVTVDFAKGSSGSGLFDRNGNLTGLVANTRSIYFKNSDGKKENLQMVIRSCVPVRSIRELIAVPGKQ